MSIRRDIRRSRDYEQVVVDYVSDCLSCKCYDMSLFMCL